MAENIIKKSRLDSLGYGFIAPEYLPKGKDEYYLRNMQNRNGIQYRQLNAYEIEVLVRNKNTSDDWNKILVSDTFNPELVKNCSFFGLVRIGKLEDCCLEFSDLKMPVGLYNSTIISCDFGDNVSIDNVRYLSHYIIGSEVIIVNVSELATTDHTKFGNGIVKEGEPESVRIWLEICNENGGRKVLPFNGMLPADAYMWSKYRDDDVLLEKFKAFTESEFHKERGYYGKVGDRTVIKNCSIVKDVWIGSDAYIKGANKLKNLTINSSPDEGRTQIGEGCELVNGSVGFGCRIFYGVKAVRFVMASHSQLKYGARLINSYLGNNATISCCEVLNSLIFPAHEQHHNNSFLCAALIMGQSNIAAGATIGSNHNSRSPDGEIVAGRGFWPGLCVSLKHNSKFACYTLLAKGDYPTELNVRIPFALVANDVSNTKLIVMPGYWFLYNMYAIVRNSWKYLDRDKRKQRIQHIEYDYLAPDSINELFDGLTEIEIATGKAWYRKNQEEIGTSESTFHKKGKEHLSQNDKIVDSLEILLEGVENSKRPVQVIKARESYSRCIDQIAYYGVIHLIRFIKENKISSLKQLQTMLPSKMKREPWTNLGGQLLPESELNKLKSRIKTGKIKSWDELHAAYTKLGESYEEEKTVHALASLEEVKGIALRRIDKKTLGAILDESVRIKTWMFDSIYNARAKDYTSPYRKMVYDTQKEMEEVTGKFEDNSFIKEQQAELNAFKKQITSLKKSLK